MNFVKRFFGLIIGLLFGAAAAMFLAPAAAAFGSDEQGRGGMLMIVVLVIGGLLGMLAPTIRRAFGRGFLLLGASVFALPLSVLLLSGRAASDMLAETAANEQAATAVGAGIAGVLMTGASAFIGFFLGTIFILIGLVLALGGRREVIIVERVSPSTATRLNPPA